MFVNANRPNLWKADIAQSVDHYNAWFMQFAPQTYRDTRVRVTKIVEKALTATAYLTDIAPTVLRQDPSVLRMLRMATAPPLARDRLIGLADVPDSMVNRMEDEQKLPQRMPSAEIDVNLQKIGNLIEKLADKDLCPWLEPRRQPTPEEMHRSATVIADRFCGAEANPLIRNAQEERQLKLIRAWLEQRGYTFLPSGQGIKLAGIKPGTFAFHFNVPIQQPGAKKQVNITVDVVVQPKQAQPNALPLLIEAKSAGDFTNTNKRRKEEATKMAQLQTTYGKGIQFILFLCGYFGTPYLGYEAAEGIDWVWEHRIDDLALFGV